MSALNNSSNNTSFDPILNSPYRLIVGNWKMYKTIEESLDYIKELISLISQTVNPVYLAVPFTAISAVASVCEGTPIKIGAQNMHDASQGAFTGEIAGRMLKEAGASFVILGHSERRLYFGETNSFINRKIHAALAHDLQPLLCIGETDQQREQGLTESVLSAQLKECLAEINQEEMKKVILAYEPVWAIGTNQVASVELIKEVHDFCHHFLVQQFGTNAAHLPLLYGGSVKPENAADLLKEPSIAGFLIGSVSLEPILFSQIVNLKISTQV